MATVPEIINNISHDIQHTFEQLMKLVLRKTLHPTLNPLGPNTRVIYNPSTGKYERGYIGYSPDDNINKYSYLLTNDCLGWAGDSVTTFKVLAKFIKNKNPSRSPQGAAYTRNGRLPKNYVAYSGTAKKYALTTGRILKYPSQYKNFIEYIFAQNMQSIISNRDASYAYTCDVPFIDCFEQLENIGQDLLGQIDPIIPESQSVKMSTAALRADLYTINKDLFDMSVNYPDIYYAYLRMVRLINSVDRTVMPWVINLIATLSYQDWSALTVKQQAGFIEHIGQDFINEFISNELITVLLQSDTVQLILTSSYLYSLLKMLFPTFGFTSLTPPVSDCQKTPSCCLTTTPSCSQTDAYICVPSVCSPECAPISECIYRTIDSFVELYPTLTEIMGTDTIFPPCSTMNCTKIPPNYDCLVTIQQFLWRYNNYSYCIYLDYIGSKKVAIALSTKITYKTKYLQSL